MDRSWVHADRRSHEYKLGVAEFCQFALGNARDPNRICCPCTKCGNVKDFSAQVIKDHLFVNGINTDYVKWTEHGEVVVESGSCTDSESLESEPIESDSVQGNMRADYEVQLDSDVELEGDEDEELSSECNEFKKFVDDANKPLYPGCNRHTKMNVLVRLYNLKAKHGMSDSAYSDWLIAFAEYLPEGNEIPSSVYEAKKSLSALGMDYTKIHACPNDCILYRKQYADDTICPTCGTSRWKICKNKKEREGVPAKVLWYFPPIPRFKRMFQSTETSKALTWHATERNKDGLIRHPADSAAWKLVDEKWADFGNEPRNLRFALSSDGFNPFSSLSSKYSCWPVILVTYNLPPWLVMKRKHMKRHAVTMSRITNRKSRKCKKVVLFNRKGTPCGKVAKQMQSYIGVLARRKVPVIRENWKAVTLEEKNKIWQRVQIPFLIGPEHKKLVLESAARKWRQFKCLLTSKYVIPYLDDPEALQYPPDDYPFINADHWTEFVKMRTKPSFLEKRREQQERRSKNKYPHRMSRKGYAGLEAELADGMSDGEVDRATLWIRGRQTKDGSFKDEESAKTAENITNLKRKLDSGELSAEGSNDVLTLALGTPEHGGRVRGVGGFVTPSTYFHLPKRRKESIEATVRLSVQKILSEEREKIVEEAREKILEEAREEIVREAREKIVAEERAMWVAKFAELEAKINGKEAATIHPHVSGHGSCSMTANEIAQETDKGPLEEVVNNVDGAKILSVFEEMENKTIMCKRKGTKVVKEGRLDKSPRCKKGNEFPKLLEKVVVNREEVNEAVEENVNMIDIKEPENEEGAEYVDLTMRQPTLKSNVAEVDCKLAIGSVEHIVAYATVMECEDPSQLVHGTPLGDGNVRVSIYAALEEKEKVPFPVKDEIETVKQAMGSWVAWPKHLVIKSAVKKPTKDKADKKKKRKEIGEEDSEIEFGLAKLAPSLPASLKMLCLWGEDAFKDGNTINFYMEPEVFGYSRKTFILGKDVRRLASMREVTGTCIAVYQRYLYDKLKAYKMLDMVAFVDPSLIGAVGCGNGTVKAQNIKDRLVTAKPGQMFMLPYNSGDHWVLTLVDPEKGTAYFMDPLKRRLPTGDWMSIVDTAMRMYISEKNKQSRSSVHWKNLAGIPPQPSNKECGYFIMRYMRDIIEDKDMSLFPSKWERRGSSQYTQADIDQVRNEWGKFVVNTYVHES